MILSEIYPDLQVSIKIFLDAIAGVILAAFAERFRSQILLGTDE